MSERPFDLARRVPVAELAGVALRKYGRDLFGPCPHCGGEKGSQRFHVTPAANTWHCFGCKHGGGPLELYVLMQTGRPAKGMAFPDLLEHARALAGGGLAAPPAPPKAHQTHEPARPAGPPRWAEIWAGAKPATGTLVETWLASRGLDVSLHRDAIARLRFNANARAAAGRDERSGKWWRIDAPAMVAPIVNNQGQLQGVHCTYLSRTGDAKAVLIDPAGELVAARKMWGRAQGHCVPLTRLRDAEPWALGPLIVGEGVETCLSFAEPWARDGAPLRIAAVLSLGNLQGGWLTDSEGRATRPPMADPSRPPWTLPAPGHVVPLIDRDMAAMRIKRHAHFGADEMADMSADERAAFCAALTAQHWRAAGALSVTPVQPITVGDDFNDALKRATPQRANP